MHACPLEISNDSKRNSDPHLQTKVRKKTSEKTMQVKNLLQEGPGIGCK